MTKSDHLRGYIEQKTGQPAQRAIDKNAQAKKKAAQAKRLRDYLPGGKYYPIKK